MHEESRAIADSLDREAVLQSSHAAVEQIVGRTLIGHAFDPVDPGRAAVVDVLINGRHAQSVKADGWRTDLQSCSQSPGAFAIPVDEAAGTQSVALRLSTETEPFFHQLLSKPTSPVARAVDLYRRWQRQYDISRPEALASARSAAAGRTATVSVVVAGDADMRFWVRTLASIDAQIVPAARTLLVDSPPGIAVDGVARCSVANWAEVLAMAAEGPVLFVPAGDVLAPAASLLLADALGAAGTTPFVYADEDRPLADTDASRLPVFKTEWDSELARVQDAAFAPALAHGTVFADLGTGPVTADSWRAALYASVRATGQPPVHLPFVLLHRQATYAALTNPVPIAPRTGAPDAWPLVSVVIPTRDRLELLAQCVEGVLHETDYPAVEVIIVDNDSVDPATLTYLARVERDPRVRVLRSPGPFDYAGLNNGAVATAGGRVVALLNNDIKVARAGWLRLLVREAMRDDVGAVGARLLYDDGRIQHAGIALGIGEVASHICKRRAGNSGGPNGRLRHLHQVCAVTAACLVVRRELWDLVGGLSSEFPVAFNDVDFCLQLHARGYRNLVQPAACLVHLESASRGLEESEEARARFAVDKQRMLDRWGGLIERDPFVSPNWSLDSVAGDPAFPPRVRASFD